MGWSQAGWGALIMLGLEKIGHLITGFISRKRKQPGISKATPRLLELESRLVPASAVFTNVANVPLLTINLAANEAFDYLNEYKNPANSNALTATAGYFKLSSWNSTTNSFDPAKWSKLTDTTKTFINNQVGNGIALDSIQLATGKSINGINIKVVGGSAWDGAYFRANPDRPDGIFTGTLTVDSTVDDSVVQDYALVSKNDINLLSPMVTAYADILGDKNVTLTTALGASPVFYVEGSRTIQAGGSAGNAGYNLIINSTIEATTIGGANLPLNAARIVNPGGPVTLGSGAGGNLPNTVLDGLDVKASSILLKGSFYFASEYMRLHAPVTIDSATTTTFSVDTELLLEKGIKSGSTPRSVAFEVNGGAIATINALPDGATSTFSGVDFRPTPGSEGAKVILATNIKTTTTTGLIKINLPLYLAADTKLETSGSGTVQLGAAGSIQSLDRLKPSKLTVASTQFQLSGTIGDENPLSSLAIVGGIKTLAATSITTVGDIIQSGSTSNIQITGRLGATSQSGNIKLPNFFKSADTAGTGTLDFSAPNGQIALYTGSDPNLATMTLAGIKLAALNSIEVSPNLTATGPIGISVVGPQMLKSDLTYTVNSSSAPITLGGIDSESSVTRSLQLLLAGGAASIQSNVGKTNGLNNLQITGAGSVTTSATVQATGFVSFQADDLSIGSTISAPSIVLTNTTAGKPIALGDNLVENLGLDGTELANLVAKQITVGSNSAKTPSGIIILAGDAKFSPSTSNLRLLAPEGISTINAGGITVANLTVEAAKASTLSGKNNVRTLAGQFNSDLLFANVGALTLGSAGLGLTVGGAANITSTGPLTQASALNISGLVEISATGGTGKEQNITLNNPANLFTAVKLGSAGAVQLAASGNLKLAQSVTSVSGSLLPAAIGSLEATSGPSGNLTLASNLQMGGSIKLTSAKPITLDGETTIRSITQTGAGIHVQGGISNANGAGLTLDAGHGSLAVDSIDITGSLTIPSFGGPSDLNGLKAGPVTILNGAGSMELGSPLTPSLTIHDGLFDISIDSVANILALSAKNTGFTTLGSGNTPGINLPANTLIGKLALNLAVKSIGFSGNSTLVNAFIIPQGATFTTGNSGSDTLIAPNGITASEGAVLKGDGVLKGSARVQGGGVFSPGGLNIQGDLKLDTNATFQTDISQSTLIGGTGHLVVDGKADISNATLQLTNQTDYKLKPDQIFTTLESGSGGSVVGTFADLPNGSKIKNLGTTFAINYQTGTSGRDVQIKTVTDGNNEPTAPTFTNTPTATFVLDNSGSYPLIANGFPLPQFSILQGALPNGLALDKTTGLISGTPTGISGGVFQITFQASNGVGTAATQAFTLTLNQPPAIQSHIETTFVTGKSKSFTFSATGFPIPEFSITGTLPQGVSWDSTTSTLSGTATEYAGGTYGLVVNASNGVGLAASQNFTLTVNQAPVFANLDHTTFTAGSEGAFTFIATGYPKPTFATTSQLPDGITLDTTTGNLAGIPAANAGGHYAITVIASNGVGDTASQNFTLTVNQAPAFANLDHATFTAGSEGAFTFIATGYPKPTFATTSQLPDGITLDTTTGNLTGIPAANAGGRYAITVIASNGVGDPASQNFTLTVNQAPAFANLDHATFTAGSKGAFTFITTGYPKPTFATTSQLPDGITLDTTTGNLAGIPAANAGGHYAITVIASNGVGASTSQSFTLTVNQAPAFTNLDHATFTAGSEGAFTFIATGFPKPTFATTSQLPNGITLDTATGNLAGIPAANAGGHYAITVIASNGVGADTSQSFTLTVNQAPAFTSPDNATFTLNEFGSFTVSSESYPAATYTIVDGALPNGLSLDYASGVLSGTPANTEGGLIKFTIAANNLLQPDTLQPFTLSLNEPSSITTTDHATFTIGQSNSFTFGAGGFPTAHFMLAGDSSPLPLGISLSSEGILSGNPAQGLEGTYSFIVSASNGIGLAATQNFTLTVNPAENQGGNSNTGSLGGETAIPLGVYAIAVKGTADSYSKLLIYQNGTHDLVREVIPFPGFRGEFYVDSGDISADGYDDIIVGSGNGSPNGHVVFFDGKRLLDKNAPAENNYKQEGSVRASLYAFIGYSSGVAVRLANMNGDKYADIILGPGTGAGTVTASHLRVWDGQLSMAQFENGVPFSSYNYKEWELASFWAFGSDDAPGGGLSLSIIHQADRDWIVASQLFGPGIKTFSYKAGLNGMLHLEQDLTGWANPTGNTTVILDTLGGQRLYVNGGFSPTSPDSVFVRDKNQKLIYTITNTFGGNPSSMRLGLKNIDDDIQPELLVTRNGSADTVAYKLGDTSFSLITTLNAGGSAGWV